MSYNNPITMISRFVDEQIKEQQTQEETAIMTEITKQIGIDVDKDELIRALNYDRHQYEKGQNDALEKIKAIKAEIKEWYWQSDKQELAKDPCVVDAMIDLFIRTIDKHIEENN